MEGLVIVGKLENWRPLSLFHTDLKIPETVPWTGLEASTRAYARIVDEVNKLDLSVLQRPEEPTP